MLKKCWTLTSVLAVTGLAAAWAVAQPPADTKTKAPAPKPAAKEQPPQGGPQLTPQQMADMQAYVAAATPGKEHAWLQKSVGKWEYTMKHWMEPGATPMESKGTSEAVSLLEGRFTRMKVDGDMGPMGAFNGIGIYGYDNVAKEYQCFWIDSMGTGMTNGTGKLSADGKTMTWVMTYNCPVKKGPVTMREVETYKGDDECVMEIYMNDPHGGKEYKAMEMTSKRVGAAPAKAPAPKPTGAR